MWSAEDAARAKQPAANVPAAPKASAPAAPPKVFLGKR